MPDLWSQDSATPEGIVEADEEVGGKSRRGGVIKKEALERRTLISGRTKRGALMGREWRTRTN